MEASIWEPLCRSGCMDAYMRAFALEPLCRSLSVWEPQGWSVYMGASIYRFYSNMNLYMGASIWEPLCRSCCMGAQCELLPGSLYIGASLFGSLKVGVSV